MYFCSLKFTVIGDKGSIEKVLSVVEPPEDCGFEFREYDGENEIVGLDSAVIVDGREGIDAEDIPSAPYTAVIVPADRLSEASERLPENAYIWAVPADNSGFDGILRRYFVRLVGQMKESFDARRLKVCFETALDSVPDLIWFKDEKGAHLIVNNGFCGAVAKTKEQIYKKGHYYIWDIPKEEYDQGDYVCLESEDIVIKSGKTCLFDEKVKTKSGMRQFKTYKSPLTDPDGYVFGTCGIAKDVTDLHNINNELQAVIESMPFAAMVEDESDSVISVNSKFGEYFPESEGKDLSLWKKELLKTAAVKDNGIAELVITRDGEERIITFREEPIFDVFHETIGSISIFSDVTLEYMIRQQTIHTANTDFLTGLGNRRSLFAHLEQKKSSQTLAMITVDLDNFKQVNDKYGHKMGDEALRGISSILKECFWEDFIARMGGDEFLIVIDRPCSETQITEQTERFLNKLRALYAQSREFAIMTASAGIVLETLPPEGVHDTEKLIHMSDIALYNVKNSGKGSYQVYRE